VKIVEPRKKKKVNEAKKPAFVYTKESKSIPTRYQNILADLMLLGCWVFEEHVLAVLTCFSTSGSSLWKKISFLASRFLALSDAQAHPKPQNRKNTRDSEFKFA
jgi:hypothetical protein